MILIFGTFLNEPIKNFIELYKSKDSQRKNYNKFFKEEDDKNLNFISNKINSILDKNTFWNNRIIADYKDLACNIFNITLP